MQEHQRRTLAVHASDDLGPISRHCSVDRLVARLVRFAKEGEQTLGDEFGGEDVGGVALSVEDGDASVGQRSRHIPDGGLEAVGSGVSLHSSAVWAR
jgi:hypothetical protein